MLGLSSWAWAVWGVASFASFLVLELIALTNKAPGDTLSERLREWLGFVPYRPLRRYTLPAFIALTVGFGVWFIPHITLSVW